MRRPRIAAAVLALVASVLGGGCAEILYFARSPTAPMPAWEVRMDPVERRDCLVVLLPGLFDLPEDFLRQGFVSDALRVSRACDFVAVDSHVGYYQRAEIVERLHGDVIALAHARGYRRIWLVGISMGALGATLLASEHADSIEGLVLFAPWLGDDAVVNAATEAGGLDTWDPDGPRSAGETDLLGPVSRHALRWLRAQEGARDGPTILLGVGDDDRRRAAADLIASTLPETHVFAAPGQHDWPTWRVLWRAILARPPWASARSRARRPQSSSR